MMSSFRLNWILQRGARLSRRLGPPKYHDGDSLFEGGSVLSTIFFAINARRFYS